MADPIDVAPDGYSVMLENDRMRVPKYSGESGAKTATHSHPDLVAIPLSDGMAKFTMANGETQEAEMHAGGAMFMPSHDNATEVTGEGMMEGVIVELK